jgi:pSer/pThr/pTyr-binding forkhead associated (FHA) protein
MEMIEPDRLDDETPVCNMPAIVSTIQVEDIDLEISHLMGNAISSERAGIILAFNGAKLVVRFDLTDSIILGRDQDINFRETYTDLTPYQAVEKGVSRRHAVLHRVKRTIMITDLGSRNGTFLNGERLLPQQARIVRHGDQIQLGRLMFHIQFA